MISSMCMAWEKCNWLLFCFIIFSRIKQKVVNATCKKLFEVETQNSSSGHWFSVCSTTSIFSIYSKK